MTRAPRALDTAVTIETPEHIAFEYRVAGPARRAVAHVLDLLLCYGAFAVVAVVVTAGVVGASFMGELSDLAKASVGILLVLLFFVQWIYFMLWEALRGTTPGKMALGLAVVTTNGRPIGFREAALRNLLRAADALPTAYVVGVACQAATDRFQRLGDLVAGTMVILPERPAAKRALALHPPATEKELDLFPSLVTLDPEERAAIELFLRRRGELGHARSVELAGMVAPALAARFGVPLGDPIRFLALLHDRATRAGRDEDAPPSSREAPVSSRRAA
jgi:uncharacterized RDD family membrane protein YckC